MCNPSANFKATFCESSEVNIFDIETDNNENLLSKSLRKAKGKSDI